MPDDAPKIKLNHKYKPLFDSKCQARYYIVIGGRGSGKSYGVSLSSGVDLLNRQVPKHTLYLRQTLVSAHISIIPEFKQKLELLGCGEFVDCGKTNISLTSNGSCIFFRGIQTSRGSNEANLKSVKDVVTVIIDEAQEVIDEAVFDRIDLSVRDTQVQNRIILSLNPTDKNHWIYRRFFKNRNIPEDFNGIVGDTCYIHTTFEDNRENLSKDFLDIAYKCREEDIEKFNNIFLGLWRGDNEGALWTESMIEPFRVSCIPDGGLDRVVVAVDPAVTGSKDSDETGIVVVGKKRIRGDMHYYVIDDRSFRGSPDAWSSAVVNAFFHHEADRVIAEVNNGGDLVEATIKVACRNLPYRAVRATRGKIRRAEPIAALYERGFVHHVGVFPNLEYQMRNYNGIDKAYSPDRMDALVWGLTELSSSGMGSRAVLA